MPKGRDRQSEFAAPSKRTRVRGRGRGLSLPKRVLFALVTAGVFFIGIEAILAVAGVRPLLYEQDPFVGFASSIRHFQVNPDAQSPPGADTMVFTQPKLSFFQPQQFEHPKVPETYRIFCMGGSTTYGRPYNDVTSVCGWLRAMLPQADPSRTWQLINCGGISYASYRVANLMEELVEYEPDLFIVYCGQNEFLERRTYGQIIGTPAVVRAIGAVAGKTRLYSVLKTSVDAVAQRSVAKVGQRNVLPTEVETILEQSIGPQEYHRSDLQTEQVLEHYGYNLARIVDIARSVDAKIIFVTPASKLRDCAPFKSQHRGDLGSEQQGQWHQRFTAAEAAYKAGDWELALEASDEALQIDDRYAHGHYLRGRALWAMGDYYVAKQAFIRARDEDVCPLRALSPMIQIVRQVAQQREVPLVDFVAMVDDLSAHEVPGEEVFLDHVHPTVDGNRRLAVALLQKMADEQIVNPSGAWDERAVERVRLEVESAIDRQAHGIALVNLARVLGWAGKHEESLKLGRRAQQLIPSEPQAHIQVGISAFEMGLIEESITSYRQALSIDPDHAEANNNLGIVLSEQGQMEQAVAHWKKALAVLPEYAEARTNLGAALVEQGKVDQAIKQYQLALEHKPGLAEIHTSLAAALIVQGNIDLAMQHFHKALELNPGRVGSHLRFARLLSKHGRPEQAVEHYRHALDLRPSLAGIHNEMGIVLHQAGRLEEAAAAFRKQVQLEPDLHQAHYNLGGVLALLGRLQQAIVCFQQVQELVPDHAESVNAQAWLRTVYPDSVVHDVPQALRLAEHAVELSEGADPLILDTLAAAQAAAGQFEQAVETVRRALDLASGLAQEEVAAIRNRLALYTQSKTYREESDEARKRRSDEATERRSDEG